MQDRSLMGGSLYETPFYLEKDPGNKFKVVPELQKTVVHDSEIPFLRSSLNPVDFQAKKSNNRSYLSPNRKKRSVERTLKKLSRQEQGWNNYVKPISKYNTQVHPSMRIVFEQI